MGFQSYTERDDPEFQPKESRRLAKKRNRNPRRKRIGTNTLVPIAIDESSDDDIPLIASPRRKRKVLSVPAQVGSGDQLRPVVLIPSKHPTSTPSSFALCSKTRCRLTPRRTS